MQHQFVVNVIDYLIENLWRKQDGAARGEHVCWRWRIRRLLVPSPPGELDVRELGRTAQHMNEGWARED